jgi:hypothetical protein
MASSSSASSSSADSSIKPPPLVLRVSALKRDRGGFTPEAVFPSTKWPCNVHGFTQIWEGNQKIDGNFTEKSRFERDKQGDQPVK